MIRRDFVLCDDTRDELIETFSNFRFFARMKHMLDIKTLGYNFRFGAT